MLVANDIEANVSGFYLQGGVGEIASTGLANVFVAEDDYSSANELVLEYEGNQSIENSNTSSAETVNTGAVSTGPTKKMLAITLCVRRNRPLIIYSNQERNYERLNCRTNYHSY
jgi:hypothetical protein